MTLHRTQTAVAAVVLVALARTPAGAQERALPAVGDRVRIAWRAVAPQTLRGELLEVRGDTLVVRRDDSSQRVEVPIAEVGLIEVRRLRGPMEGLGHALLIAVPIGAASGFAVGTIAESDGCADECGLFSGLLTIGGAALGTVVGTVVGIAWPGEKWAAVPIRPAAGAGGVALSVTVKL
jgi:hypothetical protein